MTDFRSPIPDDEDAQSSASCVVADDDFDAASAATRWSMGAKRNPDVPLPGTSYEAAIADRGSLGDAAGTYAAKRTDGHWRGKISPDGEDSQPHETADSAILGSDAPHDAAPSPDTATGATPGVASACRDLDMTSPAVVSERLGIKPPGIA